MKHNHLIKSFFFKKNIANKEIIPTFVTAVTDGEDGVLVQNENIQAMADKICYLKENEEVRKEMGRKAHQSAMQYAPENIMPMWEKLFNEIVKS